MYPCASGYILGCMQRISLPLPSEMLEQIDSARGDVPRTVWIRRAVEAALDPDTSVLRGMEQRAYDRLAERPRSAQPPDKDFSHLRDVPVVRASALAEKPKRVSRSSGGCALHPAAGRTESRGQWWCAEPGCTRSV